jgi:hypothetical protein
MAVATKRKRDWSRLLSDWRCEQAPSLSGAWLTAVLRDGSGSIAIAPPGLTLSVVAEIDILRWRVVWWTMAIDVYERPLDLTPSGAAAVRLVQLLVVMPTRVRKWAKGVHLQALHEEHAVLKRAEIMGDADRSRLALSFVNTLETEWQLAQKRIGASPGRSTSSHAPPQSGSRSTDADELAAILRGP